MKRKPIKIGWLYPELMSTYGDRGNIFVLTKRCQWRGIDVEIVPIDFACDEKTILSCSLLFGGGAQDRQQTLVQEDLLKRKKHALSELITQGVPGLFVCGSPQLLGEYYMTGDGTKLEGLGIFDMVSRHFGKTKARCIGNTVSTLHASFNISPSPFGRLIVGFENHGGRTYLGSRVKPFATVLYGNGNNGEDKTEGAVLNNCIATYSHGPFLPKNPHIADWLIEKALSVLGQTSISLAPLDDAMAKQARDGMCTRLGIPVS